MKTISTFGVNFYLKKQKLNNGLAPVVVRIAYAGKRAEISLIQKIDPAKWNKYKEELITTDAASKIFNRQVNEIRGRLYEIYRELQLNKSQISCTLIRSKYFGEEEQEYTLCMLMDYHNKIMKDHLQLGTAKNYWTTQKFIKQFLKEKLKTEDVFLQHLNYKFLADFDNFLRHRTPDDHQRYCTNNGVMKHIQRLRKMINMAITNEWLKHDPFIKFKPTYVKKDRGYLNEDELQKIESKIILHENTTIIRDLFIFSCYTGLAYSDARNLTTENLHKGIDGENWIIINRQKTGVQSNIPLLPQAQKIIEQYKNHPKSLNRERLLPMLSNQRFNSYLKAIAEFCGVTKNLTHHLARHTFATTVCLNNGISMEATSGMLGHSSLRTTQIYGRILPTLIGKEMATLRAKLQDKSASIIEEIKTGS
jgi:site-specific recombinase XerD